MQKKIIALAVAGLASTAAFAQSNVTVYGVADVYLANVGTAGTHVSALQSGGLAGSRIGFKGVEDLGGGTKALFTLEYALGMDTSVGTISATTTTGTTPLTTTGGNGAATTGTNGSGIGAARQAFVGLTGAYGTLIGGRLQTLAYNHNAAFNPTFGTGVDTQGSLGLAIGTAERLDNAVAYVAPAMGGVTLAAAHTFNAANAEGAYLANTRASELSAMYNNGPLAAGIVGRYVYENAANGANGGTGTKGDASVALGGSYDFGVAKVLLNVAKAQNNSSTAALSVGNSAVTLVNIGAVVPVSAAGAVIVSYGKSQNRAGYDATAYTALYKHSLSKRTSLYGGLAKASADGGAITYAGITSTGTQGDVAVALAGINHSF